MIHCTLFIVVLQCIYIFQLANGCLSSETSDRNLVHAASGWRIAASGSSVAVDTAVNVVASKMIPDFI